MADNDNGFAAFNFDFSNHLKINKRVGVRYTAPPSTLKLRNNNLLNFGSEFTGKLLDISAKGALIACSNTLSMTTKLALQILFADGTLFNLKGKVVREKSLHHYGIKFDDYNKELDEYLYKLLGNISPK